MQLVSLFVLRGPAPGCGCSLGAASPFEQTLDTTTDGSEHRTHPLFIKFAVQGIAGYRRASPDRFWKQSISIFCFWMEKAIPARISPPLPPSRRQQRPFSLVPPSAFESKTTFRHFISPGSVDPWSKKRCNIEILQGFRFPFFHSGTTRVPFRKNRGSSTH